MVKDIEILSQNIKHKALDLGFSLVGISKAKLSDKTSERLDDWILNNYHASMKWIENRAEERKNIFHYYPQAKSIISVGLNYFTGEAKGKHKISNYAWGDDYHLIVKSKLRELLSYIKSTKKGIDGIVCVDTSPVMEKVVAQNAGLGWIGKNTNLLTKDFGSWVFLGEIILNIELDYNDTTPQNYCGDCTKCIDACPTNALVKPYVLDSNQCISYLTIEHRNEIDLELFDRFNGWIYGCDICQQVCPWNIKFSKITEMDEFKERELIIKHSKDNWQNLTEDEFKEIFKKSPVKRTKFVGLKRNLDITN
ncbi:MAG: tRNA epoxyqueuosine(34) reductase QueG [Candidatus Marinimicrobia bacterium]|nr:tRNA epoxyqueuosine(34) reductase QueG [Candidatus Neomarinimicrobiota bacterium]MBL7023375.1 tRNA epoxyqueuosine(34) reductase QueG [Candidatus Neomarinimicrobiota bacterium]MBL7109744.1 tRNA epoxyqueuosine(34) reductase QueG [Candidatus Neomarinimicrobiota bacterium]